MVYLLIIQGEGEGEGEESCEKDEMSVSVNGKYRVFRYYFASADGTDRVKRNSV
jgi:hypothetical protein